jgi:protein TilB
MVEITRDLLRTRAEHNEKMLSNLEEISLHQQNIGSMNGIQDFCKHLKIVLLQNNLIEKIEGCTKMKELEYLNLAVNSVNTIGGLRRCESLRKMDFTLNFIDAEDLKSSCEELEWNPVFSELFMMGNPCMDWEEAKDYIIAKVDTINRLDGIDITKSMRMAAKLKLVQMEKDLEELAQKSVAKKEWEKKEGIFHEGKYSREQRWADYTEQEE